jgi:hypothetical protein
MLGKCGRAEAWSEVLVGSEEVVGCGTLCGLKCLATVWDGGECEACGWWYDVKGTCSCSRKQSGVPSRMQIVVVQMNCKPLSGLATHD